MMDDYSAFIRAICENPADDLVRLVFADWLADNGEEDRGEFIRESIRKNRNPSEGDYGGLQSVLERHWKSWVPECENGRIGFELRRGFVSEIRLPLADFLACAGELFSAHPIERVVLTDRKPADGYLWCDGGPRVFPPGSSWNRHWLPSCIFKELAGSISTPHARNHRKYGTRDAANADRSAACVSYGRASANLPPLPLATPPMKEPHAQT